MIEEQSAQATQELEEIKNYITKGQKAKEVLNNEEFQLWFRESQDALFDVLDTIPLNDNAARQRCNDLIYLFRKFEKTFKELVETAEVAEKRWKEITEGDKKKGLLGRIFDV